MNKTAQNKEVLWIHNFNNVTKKDAVWLLNQQKHFEDCVDDYYLNNLRNPISFLKHIITLFQLAKQYKIVHAQYGSAVGFITSLLPTKRIVTLRGSDWYKAPANSLKDKIRIAIGHQLTKLSLSRFDEIIVMSDKMKQQILANHKNLSIHVIPDPMDLERFYPIEREGANSDVKKVMFSTVKKDNPIKRYDLAKKSFDLLKEKNPNVDLIMMNNVPHDKVNEFINGTDLVLLTSTHEGWPNIIKEALACNTPFVATDVSDLKSIAEQTKNCFVTDDDPILLAEALEKALSSGKNENLRKFVSSFEMKDTVSEIKKVYSLVK